jgi:serine/threonine-protein kinase
MRRGIQDAGFYKQDWFVALLIGLAFALVTLSSSSLFEKFESMAYDAGVRMTHRTSGATENVAIIAIDDPSIERIGRWPWPRHVLAEMLDRLGRAQARAVGLLIFLGEAQTDPGLTYIRKLKEVAAGPGFARHPQGREITQLLTQAETELDADGRLAASIAGGHGLYLSMFFQIGAPLGKPDKPLPEFVSRNRLPKIITRTGANTAPISTTAANYPLDRFSEHSAGIGHLNLFKDVNGGVRSEALVLEHFGEYYPSLALLLAARSLNLGTNDIEVELGQSVRIGRLSISTTPQMEMYTGFYPPRGDGESAFATYSFHDVLAEKVPPQVFHNKVVLIGATAVGIGGSHTTPIQATMKDPELTANILASILNQDFYTRPGWTVWAEAGLLLAITLYLMLALPQMGAKVAALVSALLMLTLIVSEQYLMVSEKLWLRAVTPALLLLVGHVALTSKRFFQTERQKIEAETDSAHTNRMLGLTFQGQGQFDMALDKFRQLPVDESVLELIYNLALDFERKRQFNKAAAAYDYILRHNARFRDVPQRKKQALHAENTFILGGAKGTSVGGTMVLDGSHQKPVLGRYEVEKELGKGTMGVVYLGRDPKINRVVAIKTLALGQEFEGTDLTQAKERFFREAETAGRLNHPNIVTIYDAGEEHDLAYIAMEFLQGKDLSHFVRDTTPPLDWVLDVTAHIADALDYAHRHDVVHRDIKPANIMCLDANQTVKVTDFGIARITASSRTRTGVVLGTPSYMSPEQVAGKHVDGRSDLFSLGVMLFELTTGQLPFGGDSMATLMYQIANAAHPDPRSLRPDLPDCVVAILNRSLKKNPAKRYQTGVAFKEDLLACRAQLDPGKGKT